MDSAAITVGAVHHDLRDALSRDVDGESGGVFDGGGGRINLIKKSGTVFDGGGGVRCGLWTSNGVVRFNDGGGGPFDGGWECVRWVNGESVFDYSSLSVVTTQLIGTFGIRIGSRDRNVVLRVNGLLDGCVVCLLSSFASTSFFAYLSGGQFICQPIGRVWCGVQSRDQCVCCVSIIECADFNESVVVNGGVVSGIVRVCCFGCLWSNSVMVAVVVLLHQPASLHTDVCAIMLLPAFLLISALGILLYCSAAVFCCVRLVSCYMSAAVFVNTSAALPNARCYSDAGCGVRSRWVDCAHRAGNRPACIAITVINIHLFAV
jgi:hypothetical protein